MASDSEIAALIRTALSERDIDNRDAVPFQGEKVLIEFIENLEDARNAVKRWRDTGAQENHLERMKSDLHFYTLFGNVTTAQNFDKRYVNFFGPGHSLSDNSIRRSFAFIWKALPSTR